MWITLALLSAVCAALVAVFAKMGLQNLDATLATTIRSVIMAAVLVVTALVFGKFSSTSVGSVTGKEWLFIVLSGVAGALSWLFYFIAIQQGDTKAVAALDRLSIVFVVIFAAFLLGDKLTVSSVGGALLIVAGALLITMGA